MKTLNFKTNISDHEAVTAVTLPLNAIEPLDGWNIDLENKDHLLTVQTVDNRVADQVVAAVTKAGYEAELIPELSNV